MDFSENTTRRRTKALYKYLEYLESSNKSEIDSFQFSFQLSQINFVPINLKNKFKNTKSIKKDKLTKLKSVLEKNLNEKQKSNEEKLIEDFYDFIEDFFDDSIPDEYKLKYPKELQNLWEKIISQFSIDELEAIKSKNQLKSSFRNKVKTFEQKFLSTNKIQLFLQSILKDALKEEIENFAVQIKNELKNLLELEKGLSLLRLPCPGGNSPDEPDTNVVKTFFEQSEKIAGIKELAKEIGKHGETKEQKSAKKQRTYRGNIIGLEFSNDVNRILPSELSLLMKEETELLFYKKFAEKKLLSFSYGKKATGEKQEKGPAIICIDTSGSMYGEPENIAKSLCLFILLECIKEKRSCFIISFSISIECLDLTNISDKAVLRKFLDFLSHSFHGGTDVEPCLNQALKILEEKTFEKADVLVISDFLISDLTKEMKYKMKAQKQKDTRFFSLLINDYDNGNKNVIKEFTDKWFYKNQKIYKQRK